MLGVECQVKVCKCLGIGCMMLSRIGGIGGYCCTFVEGVDLDIGLLGGGERAEGRLALAAELFVLVGLFVCW